MEISKADVLEALFQADLDERDVSWAYSGRFMYGKTCFGVTASLADFLKFMVYLAAEIGEEEASLLADKVSSDSLGRSLIYYFPGVNVVDYDEEGDENE